MGFVTVLLRFTAPVAFAAVGESVGQRAGVINIGLEGMMLMASYFAVVVTEITGNLWAGFACGVAAALAVGALQSLFTLVLAADQIVVGTAVNLLSLGLTSTLYRARYGQSGRLISVEGPPQFWGGLDLFLVLLLVATGYVGWLMMKTKRGLIVRAVGEYPAAVEAAGFSALSTRFWASMAAAGLAGLGGAYLALGVAGSFSENMTAGRGFVAIAMVTFGRWRPAWVLGAALLVGYAESVQYTLAVRDLPVPGQLLSSLPYIVALVVLILVGKGTAMPAQLAVPYRRDR